jgi:phage-related protein
VSAEHAHPKLAEIHWEGDSREILRSFPDDIRASLGFALYELQLGRKPSVQMRRMETVGTGVYELKEGDEKAWYRVIYVSKVNDVIYVLHCLEKQSRRTDRRDLNVTKERLSRVRRRIEEQKKYAKRSKE